MFIHVVCCQQNRRTLLLDCVLCSIKNAVDSFKRVYVCDRQQTELGTINKILIGKKTGFCDTLDLKAKFAYL